ncbi:hypothetical protein MNBD_NITROSPINAE01-1053 [hydrothermal vent metagenome]|uniref:UspA domain-containing protein n=1 Tax=hydrothermal vent metagenome TaxID=652676 RepID=A0A3B1BHT4_9ZZZZ
MKPAYQKVLVAVPPPNHELYAKPLDAIRRAAASLSMLPGLHLNFLGVFSVAEELGSGGLNLMPPEILERELALHKETHRKSIEEYTKWFAGNSISHSIHVDNGDPADIVLKYAKEWDTDLILMGAHHEHGMFDIFTSNVAKSILKHAPCDVMMIASK